MTNPEMEQSLLLLKAQQLADTDLLIALIASHPEPKLLRTQWQALTGSHSTDQEALHRALPAWFRQAHEDRIARWNELLKLHG